MVVVGFYMFVGCVVDAFAFVSVNGCHYWFIQQWLQRLSDCWSLAPLGKLAVAHNFFHCNSLCSIKSYKCASVCDAPYHLLTQKYRTRRNSFDEAAKSVIVFGGLTDDLVDRGAVGKLNRCPGAICQ